MKKIVLCSALLIACGLFAACDNPNGSNDLEAPAPSNPPGLGARLALSTPPALLSEDRSAIGNSGTIVGGGEIPFFPNHVVSIINSKAEVDFKLPTYLQTNEFWEQKEIYGEDFFVDNFLVIISFMEISGSITNEVEGVYDNGDIVIHRFEPEIGNHALRLWNIVIELENEHRLEEFKAVFIEKPISF